MVKRPNIAQNYAPSSLTVRKFWHRWQYRVSHACVLSLVTGPGLSAFVGAFLLPQSLYTRNEARVEYTVRCTSFSSPRAAFALVLFCVGAPMEAGDRS